MQLELIEPSHQLAADATKHLRGARQARPKTLLGGRRRATTNSSAIAIITTKQLWPLFVLLAAIAIVISRSEISAATNSHFSSNSGDGGGDDDGDEEELRIGAQQSSDYDLWQRAGQSERLVVPPARTRKRENELLDPFVFTFEDYLREASGSSPTSGNQHMTNNNLDETNHKQHNHQNQEDDNKISPNPRANLIIENDDNDHNDHLSANANSNKLAGSTFVHRPHPNFYIFPAAREDFDANRRESSADARITTASISDEPNNDQDGMPEVKLLFAWRALATNKCSRDCGRGRRLNRLSCLDLKFNVRVEDELCERAGLTRPSELSDEPCNELDCPPEWKTVEFQRCTQSHEEASELAQQSSSLCKSKLFKRLECSMVNRLGQTIRLDESHCNGDGGGGGDKATPARNNIEEDLRRANHQDEELNIDLNEQLDRERNRILSSDELLAAHEHGSESRGHHHNRQQNKQKHWPRSGEPFYEPGDWTECSGAPACGQLGKRTRPLNCRLYLARSAKFVDLPESACATGATLQPDREEPCYLDCSPNADLLRTQYSLTSATDLDQDVELTIQGAHERQAQATQNEDKNNDEEELIVDHELARFKWRNATDWTKCSADCLGGLSESLVECWDRVVNVSVEEELCSKAGDKPKALQRVCNEVACTPEWRLSQFSQCSRLCGSTGTRTRSVACVQRIPPANEANFLLVSSDLCLKLNMSQPHSSEPCNRHNCKPEWSVGPWTECSAKCGEGAGLRNRTVICVQEFANQWDSAKGANNETTISAELREAIQMGAKDWQPGKAIQVPFSECFREYHSVPKVSERCHMIENCPSIGEDNKAYIDSDPMQDYRMILPDGTPNNLNMKRRTVTLKVGGRAQVLEGRNLKIKCRVIRQYHSELVNVKGSGANGSQPGVEWRKDGVRIFAANTTMAEKQLVQDQTPAPDNSIWGDDVLDNELMLDKYSLMAADEPEAKRAQRLALTDGIEATTTTSTTKRPQRQKSRVLSVRSWPFKGGDGGGEMTQDQQLAAAGFQFVAQPGGRFTLVKENTLRIKRLRPDDSGLYTCSSGSHLSESIEVSVVSKQHHQRHNRAKSFNGLNLMPPTSAFAPNQH